MSGETITVEGTVEKVERSDFYTVACDLGGRLLRLMAKRSGRLVVNRIYIVPGDRVKVEISPYDPTRGRITYRHNDSGPR